MSDVGGLGVVSVVLNVVGYVVVGDCDELEAIQNLGCLPILF